MVKGLNFRLQRTTQWQGGGIKPGTSRFLIQPAKLHYLHKGKWCSHCSVTILLKWLNSTVRPSQCKKMCCNTLRLILQSFLISQIRQRETSPIMFYREDICQHTLFLLFKCSKYQIKEFFVPLPNSSLVNILITVGVVTDIFAIGFKNFAFILQVSQVSPSQYMQVRGDLMMILQRRQQLILPSYYQFFSNIPNISYSPIDSCAGRKRPCENPPPISCAGRNWP